jgi:hypothetical protein
MLHFSDLCNLKAYHTLLHYTYFDNLLSSLLAVLIEVNF